MLRATDVWFGYDERTPVLRGVSIDVADDALLGILGPNGSGKTTLLRLLAGTRHPQRGAVALDGTPLARLSRTAVASRMAVVPQETHLAFDYTVAEVAMMGRYPHLGTFEIEGPDDIGIVDEALAATGTLALKPRLFATLSGGEKQRVVIAAALAQIFRLKPDATGSASRGVRLQAQEAGAGILLLDEPTASLDLGYQLEIVAVLQRLHRERQLAIVVSTHDLNLASTLCRTLVMMRDGVIIAAGETAGVLTRANIRLLYGVDADVVEHPSGRRLVVPLGRTPAGERG